jgi:predicted nucleic acid-binding protein
VFVDTSALVALANRADRNHKDAANYLDRIRRVPGGMITTNYVLDETFTLFRMRIGLKDTITFGEALMRSVHIR